MRRRFLCPAAGLLAVSAVLTGCVSTTDVDDEANTASPTTAATSPAPTTPPPAAVDADYAVPEATPDELSRVTFVGEGTGGVAEGESTISAVASAGQAYAVDFDCSPSSARVTVEWRAAPAEGDEPATSVGPSSVTQDCGAPGRIEGIRFDSDTLVQLFMFADELDAGWAVLLPAG